jgi:CheY-like chemotaxis protein/anti-sigma regulatory factor (Ser/Thr protein kinase)
VELINDILDLSKIESGKLSVERVHCSPVELVQDLASVMAIRAKDRGLAFEVAYGGRIPETIYTDPMRLRQILINLVGNAIKFTNEGSVRITLRHHAEGPRPQIEFEVRDTGIGMSAEHLEQLFVPFSQADHSVTRRFGGTGLGLCISQRLANALNGEIRVESQLGVGSSFRLLVAADDTAELIDPATQWTSVVAEPTPPEEIKLNCRALVAEDTRGIQYLIKRFLEAAGAEVLLAQNGQEAIDQVLENRDRGSPIDVVLMDMHMPVLSGYDAVRLLRQQKFDLPIVALTARAMQGDREKCLDAGCNDYLPKPVDRRQLLEAVARQLDANQ